MVKATKKATKRRLWFERRARGWTLLDLALRAQIWPVYVSRLEHGHAQPGPRTARVMAQIFGIPAEDLFAPAEAEGTRR